MENEVWKFYKDTRYYSHGHIYEVSNFGRVKADGVIIEPRYGQYLEFGHNLYLHIAVAKLYVPNPDNKPQVDHIDGNRYNNRADNLRWVTPKENMANENTRKLMKNKHGEKWEQACVEASFRMIEWNKKWNALTPEQKKEYSTLPKNLRKQYIDNIILLKTA